MADRQGWARKKPSSHQKRAWRNAPIQRRYFVTKGAHVDYYQKAPLGAAEATKPKGSFDLRKVTALRRAAAFAAH